MKRLLTALAVAGVLAIGAASLARAAEPFVQTGRVLISNHGDITILPGEHADGVVVIDGNADIQGSVNTIIVIDGRANLIGAQAETVVAIRSHVEVGPDTMITNEVMRLDSTVHQTGNAVIEGGVTDLAASLLAVGAMLAPALILLWLGFGLATIAWALLAAGLAGRQLREAALVLATEPVQTFFVGLGAVVLLPILAILLMVTVIGAPLGVGILLAAMPLLAFAGYVVAATWIGGWIVRQPTGTSPDGDGRPYLPVLAGVLVLTVIGLVPVLTMVTAIASVLGFGAVVRLFYRTLRGVSRPISGPAHMSTAPTGA